MSPVLGISAFYHDSAAAILDDGEVVAAAQEERFTRKRHDAAFPRHALAYCLEEAGLSLHELDSRFCLDEGLFSFRSCGSREPPKSRNRFIGFVIESRRRVGVRSRALDLRPRC
jgi:predicted NodU family carbamoyl transferase